MTNRVPVVIVGGGPVGLTMSIALSQRGVSNVVVERQHDVYPLPRAIVMDAEIHRSLIALGLADGLEPLLTPMTRADFVDSSGNEVMGIDVSSIELYGLPAVSCHYQPELDAFLLSRARSLGADVRRGSEVTEVIDSGFDVTVRIADGSVIVADYVVACDGASSPTRKRLGIELDDLAFDQDWLVIDLELAASGVAVMPNATRQVCDPVRPTTLVRGHRNFYRFEFQLQPGEDPKEMNTAEQAWNLMSPWLSANDARLIRHAAYRFHGVVARTWRDGRVFLAGDAAHQMPPFMGQGLNSGMRDAFNLSWKLALVVAGRASKDLLDTYAAERAPHATSTVHHSVDTGRLIDQIAGRVSHGIDDSSGYGGSRPQPRLGDGPLVGADPRCGAMWNRIADVPGVMTDVSLAVVTGRALTAPITDCALPVKTLVVDGADAYYVIRPDGYVALCAADEATIREQLSAATSPFRA